MRHLALVLLLAACGVQSDPDESGPDPAPPRASDAGPTTRPDAAPPPRTSPEIDGFALDVRAGDWWEFQYEETWQGRPKTSVYRFILDGPARTVNGLTVLRLRAEGAPYGSDLNPAWPYLGFSSHGIFGSEDGVKFEPIFDAWNGAWKGATGLWAHGNGGPVHVAPAIRDGLAVWQASQSGGNSCEYLPGYGQVCGAGDDPNQAFENSETFAAGIGPVATHYLGCITGGCLIEDSTLIAYHVAGKEGWSRFGSCTSSSQCGGADCYGATHRCQARCQTNDDCLPGDWCLEVGIAAYGYCFPGCNPASTPVACPTGTTCRTLQPGVSYCK